MATLQAPLHLPLLLLLLLASLATGQVPNAWGAIPVSLSSPEPRSTMGAVTASSGNGSFVMFFGLSVAVEPLGDVWLFDASKAKWRQLYANDPSLARFGHSVVPHTTADGRPGALIFGGTDGRSLFSDSFVAAFNPFSIAPLSPAATTASPTAAALARVLHTTVRLPGCAVTFGGQALDGASNEVWLLHNGATAWARGNASSGPGAKQPLPRVGHWAAAMDGMMVMGGGCPTAGSSLGVCNDPLFEDVWVLKASGDCQQLAWVSADLSTQRVPLYIPAVATNPAETALYTFGGHQAGGVASSDSWELSCTHTASTAACAWVASVPDSLSPLPAPRYACIAAWLPMESGWAVWGGAVNFIEDIQKEEVAWVYKPGLHVWFQVVLKTAPPPRFGAAACLLDGRAYTFGGVELSLKEFDDTWSFDLASGFWDPLLVGTAGTSPTARRGMTMTAVLNEVCIMFGGLKGTQELSEQFFNQVYALVPSPQGTSATWVLLSPGGAAPDPRNDHSAVLPSPNRVVYYGGVVAGGASTGLLLSSDTNVLTCEPARNATAGVVCAWSTLVTTSNPPARGGHAAALLSPTEMVVYGGFNGKEQPVDDLWLLDLESKAWRELAQTTTGVRPGPLQLMRAVGLAHKMVIYGGIGIAAALTNTTYVGFFNQSKWVWDVLDTTNAPPLAEPAMFLNPDNNNIVTVFGLTKTADGSTTSTAAVAQVSPGCNPGHEGAFALGPCRPCGFGAYQPLSDGTCQQCPGFSYTYTLGARDVSECNECQPNSCSSNGACSLQDFEALCRCRSGYSGRNCDTNVVAISLSVVLVVAAIAAVGAYFFWRYRKNVGFYRFHASLNQQLFEQSQTELAEYERAWEVRSSDIKLVHKLAEGAFGEVWESEWHERSVAVKKLKTSQMEFDDFAQEDFEGEVRFIRALRHPHIVLFFGAGIGDGLPFIVTELLSGSVYDLLHNQQIELPPERRMQIVLDTAHGMQYLHHELRPARMHRDLKSHNLLVSERGTVKISDFGTSRLMQHLKGPGQANRASAVDQGADGDVTLTRGVGTLLWTAPEILNIKPYGLPVDVYSFGIVLWEVWTRQVPFSDIASRFKIIEAVIEGQRPPRPSHCPADYLELMEGCQAHDPAARPTFQTIARQLEWSKAGVVAANANYLDVSPWGEGDGPAGAGASDSDALIR